MTNDADDTPPKTTLSLVPGASPESAAGRDVDGGNRSSSFDSILELLGRVYSVNFVSGYKRGPLVRRTERRMGYAEISEYQEYLELLRKDPTEVASLYRDLLIDVTQFFRDGPFWECFEQEVAPLILERHTAPTPVKVWVPGCATGEEAYSFAMMLLEQIEARGGRKRLQIFASDVSEEALEFARRGVYPQKIERDISPQRLKRFFVRDGNSYSINREVRESVTFAVHNLLADPPFSQLDLLSCRNVLIYLESHAQQRIFEVFNFALKPGGLLVLGASETAGLHTNLFEPLFEEMSIYRSKATRQFDIHPRRHLSWSSERMPHFAIGSGAEASPQGPRWGRAVEQVVLSRHSHACVAVTKELQIRSFFGPTETYLVQPTGEARMDLLAWLKPGLYVRVRRAFDEMLETKSRVVVDNLRMDDGEGVRQVRCLIEPVVHIPDSEFLALISFRDAPQREAEAGGQAKHSKSLLEQRAAAELREARLELRGALEQLKTKSAECRESNEELWTLHEQMQSSDEEFEASKEELQSLNEEMVTINRQLEEKNLELRSAYDDFNNIILSAKIPILFLSKDLRIRRFTPAMTTLMSLTASDVGRPIEEIKESYECGSLADSVRKVLQSVQPIETEVRTYDGRWYARTISPFRTQEGSVEGVCVTFHEVTARKKASAQVDEARIYAEAIVSAVPTPLVVLSPALEVVSANDAFYAKFKASAVDTVGVSLFELGNRQWDIPQLRELLECVLPEKRTVKEFEIVYQLEELGERTMQVNAYLMDREARSERILLSINDVTDQKLATQLREQRTDELIAERDRKDEFLAMLGHELRNPLSAMMHGVELLESAVSDPDRVEWVRTMMRRQGTRIAYLLDQLLDIARLRAGKISFDRVAVDLHAAVQASVEAVGPLLERCEHVLSQAIPDGQLVVLGDLARLTQVFENLLTNAAKYSENGSKIELSVEADAQEVRVRVKDDGLGIDAELLPYIFDLFTQSERTLERAEGGLGLGLPLVQRVVEAHGGRVRAYSEGVGEGSEFIVSLPRLEDRRKPSRLDHGQERVTQKGVRVLVVDDEPDCATALGDLVTDMGHQVQLAHRGEAALVAARDFAPNVVLLDLGLPEMDGYEVARRLRDQLPDRRMTIVALTGYEKDRGRLKAAGFDGHLLKPPNMDLLTAWISSGDADRR